MSVQDAQYYVSETKQFISYDELMQSDLDWETPFNNLSPYDINFTSYYTLKESMVKEGE